MGAAHMHRTARESPGSLAEQGLMRMEGYFIQSGGGMALVGPSRSVLPPVALAYLSTVYLPTHPESQIGLRSAREMRTLAMSIGLLLGGHILHGLDVLLQQFKALELAAEQGSWSQARWLELIPTSDVSSWSREDLRSAMRLGLVPPRATREPAAEAARRAEAFRLQAARKRSGTAGGTAGRAARAARAARAGARKGPQQISLRAAPPRPRLPPPQPLTSEGRAAGASRDRCRRYPHVRALFGELHCFTSCTL